MAESALQKLQARRKAMDSALESKSSLNAEESQHIEDQEIVEEIPMDETDEEGEKMKSELEQRREKSRRLLEQEEKDESKVQPSTRQSRFTQDATRSEVGQSEVSLSGRQTPSTTLPSSPRAESRSSTPFGKMTMDAKARLKSQLQARSLAKRSMSGTDKSRFDQPRRLRDRVARSKRLLALTRDPEDDSLLVSQVESTLKWKRAAELARQQRGEPSEHDCYDFFTKQYEDEEEPRDKVFTEHETQEEAPATTEPEGTPTPPPREPPPPEEEQDERAVIEEIARVSQEQLQEEEQQPEEAAEDDEEKKLISDVIAKDLDWHLFNITPAEYVGHTVQVETERLRYFIPSRIPPSYTSKIEENTAPRFLEEEGIYVGERPVVLPTNVNILENRILHQPDGGQEWFGVDGQIESLPNPIKQIQTRPWAETDFDIDENIQTFFVKAYASSTEEKYLEGSGENELQINIGTVSFFHHPLMSREHVLASNVTQMYDEYIDRKQKNYVLFFVDKLSALRNAVSDLKHHTFPRDRSDDPSVHESHVLDYICEIRRTTRQLNAAESAERDLMRRIIEEWKHIKQLREQQGYVSTTVKLTVKKEEVNKEQDKERWVEEVKLELSERRQEYNATVLRDYGKSMKKYKAQISEWNENRRKIKEQRKKNAERKNLLENDEVDDSEITIAGNVDKPQKPDKPEPFDEGTVRVTIMNELIESRRNPGEDKISLLLTNTTSLSPNSVVPSEEAARRKAVQKSSILLKVRFNGKEVFSTDPRPLSLDFKLHFGLIFRIRIVQWPESLKVQFLDDGLVSKTLFSEVFLRVPDTSVHSGNVQLGLINFSSEQVVEGEHTGVGSNTPFTLKSDDLVPTSVNTHGQLICSVSWGINEMGEVLGPKGAAADPFAVAQERAAVDPIRDMGAEAIQDPKSVTKWVQDTRLDPNDPENAALIPFMEDVEGHNVFHALDYFRLEQLQEEFNFLTDEEFEQINRFRLLRLRNEEVTEFRNITQVPCQEHEIMDSTFTPYERRMKEKTAVMLEGDKFIAAGTLSTHRLEVLQYRERVQDEVLNRFFAARHYRTFEDVVHEEQVPDVKTLGLALGKVVEPRRPLKPVRKERKKATGQALTEGSVNILVTVVRAHNLPTRQSPLLQQQNVPQAQATLTTSFRVPSPLPTAALSPTLPNTAALMAAKFYTLSPFVAVSFQDNVVTSRVATGPSPSWNEELRVPFSAPNNDYSSSSLQTVDDVLFIHLFDRHVEELPPREEDPSLIVRRTSNHWLGSFKLPFSTLYHRGNIDGTFKLKVPPVLLGYQMEVPHPTDTREEFDAQFTRYSDGSFLTLYITLHPILRPVDPVKGRFESKEDEAILSKCATFLAECQRKYPQRNVKTTVIDLKGESVLVTRYITPLQPPAELTEGSEFASITATTTIARFVSLIPFASDNVTFAGVCDLWSTCDQFIHMLKGDEEEHAVLLLNYFLHLGKLAYLILGNAIPEGNTAYVLTVETSLGEYHIWNASTGECYNSKNNLCPLKSIGALVNDKNIWFNIQPNELPSKVQFNLSKTSDWKPLFSSPPPEALSSIQPASLYYVITDQSYVSKLTHSIKEKLKNKIMSWRPRHVTRWNRACDSVLLEILKGLEQNYLRRGQVAEGFDHTAQLQTRMGEYKISGFPMDMPFTDVDSIITAVRSTEVHKIQDPNVEFSLAVYIYPYPSSVMAVWIYVAALINNRRWDL